MKMALIVSLIVLVAVNVLPAADEPAGKEQTSAQIEKLERSLAKAVTKQDTSTIDGALADDYTITGPTGHCVSKDDYMSALKDGTLKITSLELSNLNVRVYGDAAVITGTMSVNGEMSGNDIGGDYAFTNTFVKTGGKWKEVASQVTRSRD
jgi:ketosteroid isomerase-like protein